jgi:hypothetical protein
LELIITNKFNVPDVLLRAARNDKYTKGDADVSVTELIDAPQISVLRTRHRGELEADVSDRVWALLGTAVHSLLDHASEQSLTEERLYLNAGGWKISGGIDVQRQDENGLTIADYKVTTALAVIKGKTSWENQLNCYAYLVWKNKGIPVHKLEICAIIRDWSRTKARVEPDYPSNPVVVLPIPLWSVQDQELYILGRVHLHQMAREGVMSCSDEERWANGEAWACQKEGAKKASRVFDNQKEAESYAETRGLVVVRREPTYTRCQGDYCGVNRWCKQWMK